MQRVDGEIILAKPQASDLRMQKREDCLRICSLENFKRPMTRGRHSEKDSESLELDREMETVCAEEHSDRDPQRQMWVKASIHFLQD